MAARGVIRASGAKRNPGSHSVDRIVGLIFFGLRLQVES